MKIYFDVFTGDELCSDSYPMKVVDDLYYEVEGKNIVENNDIDESLIGGNKAPEGSEAAAEDGGVQSSAVTGINVVLTHKLVETPFDKASFKDWLRTYSKSLKAHLETNAPNRVQAFQAGMTKLAKEILNKFDEYRFYLGEYQLHGVMHVIG
jgi:predicted double-glycine peptidase